jgi:small nuclear ribonucleoprotein (snRNP)-like protein
MYLGGTLNNVEQHANIYIDHNNDVDNHINLGLAAV